MTPGLLSIAIRVLGRGVFDQPALQTIADQAKQIVDSPISTAVR